MISRRQLLTALACLPSLAFAQAKPKAKPAPRIGVLTSANRAGATVWLKAFQAALREVGYAGHNPLSLELRFADGKPDTLPALADELAKRGVRAIVAADEPAMRALQPVAPKLPLILASVASAAEIGQKQVELLTMLVPKLARIAIMVNPANSSHRGLFTGVGAAADARGIRLLAVEAINMDEIESAFALMRTNRAGALVIAPDGLFSQEVDRLVGLTLKRRLASIAAMPGYAPAGGLASYGVDPRAAFRLAAAKVDRILNGAKAADLAADESPRMPLIVNARTAKEIGVRIPEAVLKSADRVIT
jgi:putative tryptophan/tyrosine transport system substrate-binding protein